MKEVSRKTGITDAFTEIEFLTSGEQFSTIKLNMKPIGI